MELSTDGHEGTFRGMEMFHSLIVVMGTWLHTFVKLLELHTQKRGWILLYVNSACILLVWVTQSCPTLCGPVDCNPPGSSVHGILQARILEWVAISFSRRFSLPRDWTWVSCFGRQILSTELSLFFPMKMTNTHSLHDIKHYYDFSILKIIAKCVR